MEMTLKNRAVAITVYLALTFSVEGARINKKETADAIVGKMTSNLDCPLDVALNGKDECVDLLTMEEVPLGCCKRGQDCESLIGDAEDAYSARLSQYIVDCKMRSTDFEVGPGGHPAKVVNTSQVCSPECKEILPLPLPNNIGALREECAHMSPLALEKLADIKAVVEALETARLKCGGEAGPAQPEETGAPKEFWSGRCTMCPAWNKIHCPTGYAFTEQRACGFLSLGCEGKCVKQESKSYWNGRCTMCPAEWYGHCFGDTKLVEVRSCGLFGAFCEGKCELRW
jgi:hypothetical protein